MSRGYFVFAQGKEYIRLAYALALSIKNTQNINQICIAIDPNDHMPKDYKKVFDHVVRIKNVGLKHPMQNEYQIWDLTPFKETIHVEADMIFTSNVDHWWYELRQHDLFFTSNVKDYRGHITKSNFYRRHFEKKKLPKLYNYTLQRTPLGRWGSSDEVANLILFLLSQESSYITGNVSYVDGGWSSY